MSLTHNQIWTAIDRLAIRAKLTPSGLAKKAGLDPTTFNKSKRITPEGRPRWPSTESVAKSLAATGTKVDTFVSLITDSGKAAIPNVPLIGFAEAGADGYFDDGGFPAGKGWEEIAFPSVTDEHAYALEISGDLTPHPVGPRASAKGRHPKPFSEADALARPAEPESPIFRQAGPWPSPPCTHR